MNLKRYQYAGPLNAGAYTGGTQPLRLDTAINLSIYNHPSVIAGFQLTGGTTYLGSALTSAPWSFSNTSALTPGNSTADNMAVTYQAQDTWSVTTSATQVVIQLAGLFTSGLDGYPAGTPPGSGIRSGDSFARTNYIRNGAIAEIRVDGSTVASIDTFKQTPQYIMYLDGASHTIAIRHSGRTNGSFSLITPVVSTVGTSIGPTNATIIPTTPLPQISSQPFGWRFRALSAATYAIDQASPVAPGAALSYAQVGGVRNVGTAYGAVIPGWTFSITGTLVTSDAATFTTDASYLAIVQVALNTGTGSNTGTYQSDITDSGDQNTQWQLAEWSQSQLMSGFTLRTGTAPQLWGAALPSGLYALNTESVRTGATITQLSTTNVIDVSAVTNPAPQQVYQVGNTFTGSPKYSFSGLHPGDTYTIRFHWSENVYTTTGNRIFSVKINNVQVLTNLDIIAVTGARYKAMTQSFTAVVPSNGIIVVDLVSFTGTPMLQGIELTPSGPSAWSSTAITPTDLVLSDGSHVGQAGLQAAPRGRFAQWSIALPTSVVQTSLAWFRDVNLYYWNPEQDSQTTAKLSFGARWQMGPIMRGVMGAVATVHTKTYQDTLDLLNSFSIGNAVDKSLQMYGVDLGLPEYTGEDPIAYQNRLRATVQSNAIGGSPTYIIQQVAQLALNQTATVNSAISAGRQTVTMTLVIGIFSYTLTVAQLAGQQFSVTINTGGARALTGYTYPGFPGLPVAQAEAIITSHLLNVLTPAGSVIQPNYGAANITFS